MSDKVTMDYTPLFDPKKLLSAARKRRRGHEAAKLAGTGSAALLGADERDCLGYVYEDRIVLAVNVALATRRPLLITGLPGSGKSSLACSVARLKNWRYYEHVVTSHTQAQDLLWHFDTLRRLNDAQANKLRPDVAYIEPGVLWWAFNPDSARRRGVENLPEGVDEAEPPRQESTAPQAVVLLDEIDKADPDVPNNLLVPLGLFRFMVPGINYLVEANRENWPLVIITSNQERELPPAFLRRCIPLELQPPNAERLIEIARRRFAMVSKDYGPWYEAIARLAAPDTADRTEREGQPSTAEFLDAVLACINLQIDPREGSQAWRDIQEATLWKPRTTMDVS
ncbi:MAG TPA: MoxR family ATPase [Chloroflexia bacterium]|nr:MoxR family ATPase [Chloroflexia bacterium]